MNTLPRYGAFAKKHTIVAQYPIANLKAFPKMMVDENDNDRLDIDPETRLNTEHAIDFSLYRIKDFARENGHTGLLTKNCIGELHTLSIRSDEKTEIVGRNGTLTEASRDLNPFPDLPGAENLEWALDPMLESEHRGRLLLYIPEGQSCGET